MTASMVEKFKKLRLSAHNFTLSKPNELKLSSPLENNVISMRAKFQPCHYTKNIFYDSKNGRKIKKVSILGPNIIPSSPTNLKLSSPLKNYIISMPTKNQPCHCI